jgi:hypothetical protein
MGDYIIMEEERDYIKLNYSFEDEFGNITIYDRLMKLDCIDEEDMLGHLVDEFRRFLIAVGYDSTTVELVTYSPPSIEVECNEY